MRARIVSVCVVAITLTVAVPARASETTTLPFLPIHFGDVGATVAKPSTLRVSFLPPKPLTLDLTMATSNATLVQSPAPPPPFEYSDGYRTRATIHKWSSWAMLPLFGIEAYLGQKMFNDVGEATDSNRRLHKSIAWGIGGLFAVNTATGLPNLIESRRDPAKRDLTLIHGILMLVADAGFLATALTQPDSQTAAGLEIYTPKKNQHLTIAYASISVATIGYLLALFGR